MLIISLIFILNFAFNNKYNIRYTLYKDFTNTEEENNKNEDLNPHLNFSINLQKISIHNAIEAKNIEESGFLIISDENSKIIDKNTIISKTTSNFTVVFAYGCLFNCSDEFNNKENETNAIYYLNISYSGYKIDHENKNTPLERNNDKYHFYHEFYFNLNQSTFYEVNWNIIKYKEERGLFALFDNLFDKK